MTTQPDTSSTERDGAFDARATDVPDAHLTLSAHTDRLQMMATNAERDRDQARDLALAWQQAADTHDRLARVYRRALSYLEDQARIAGDRPIDDEPQGTRP